MQPRNRSSRIERLNRLEQEHVPNGGVTVLVGPEGKSDDEVIDKYCRRRGISAQQRARRCFVVLSDADCLI